MTMRRREFGLAALGATATLAAAALIRPAAAEASSIRIAKQYGLPYLPLMVMEQEKLVEKYAAQQGLPALRIEWPQLGGPSAFVDGLLSGQLEFGVAAVPSLATLWEKTSGTAQEVRALSAVQSQPYVVVTRNPAVRTIADFTSADRIALPSVKISGQALALQMAAAQLWGADQYDRLDPLTVSLPHPEALAALLSGKSEVNSHSTVVPYYYYELRSPGIHQVLKSYETLGGKHTNGVLQMTKRFHDENPKICAAVLAAQEEANAFIRAHPRDAAEIYRTMAKDTRDSVDDMARMIADPDNDWTTTPTKVMEFVDFMHKVGRIKRKPAAWTELFMPELHGLAGS
jgi:NitT/TauT family transport system substrate-binding protein